MGNCITVFTDASWCPQTKAAGWAVWMKYHKPGEVKPTTEYKAGGVLSIGSSYDAEVRGLVEARQIILRLIPDLRGKSVVIACDNQQAIDTFDETDLFKAGAVYVDVRHVKAHKHKAIRDAREDVNEWCDTHAKIHMRRMRDAIEKAKDLPKGPPIPAISEVALNPDIVAQLQAQRGVGAWFLG